MNFNWLNPFNKVTDLVSEVVEDKDARNRINAKLEELRQQVYMAELNTSTVPWVDALHKMSRTIISLSSIAAGVYLAGEGASLEQMAAAVAPGGIYNWVKGRGK